jgi:hypothetical protein
MTDSARRWRVDRGAGEGTQVRCVACSVGVVVVLAAGRSDRYASKLFCGNRK